MSIPAKQRTNSWAIGQVYSRRTDCLLPSQIRDIISPATKGLSPDFSFTLATRKYAFVLSLQSAFHERFPNKYFPGTSHVVSQAVCKVYHFLHLESLIVPTVSNGL